MKWSDEVARLINRMWRQIASFFRLNAGPIHGTAVLVCLLLILLLFARQFLRQEVVILAGPAGGTGDLYSDHITAEINENSNALFGQHARKVHSNGFEDTRQEIQTDESGLRVGFTHDGFGASSNVRTLLPLDEQYLHILCSKRLHDEVMEFWEEQLHEDESPHEDEVSHEEDSLHEDDGPHEGEVPHEDEADVLHGSARHDGSGETSGPDEVHSDAEESHELTSEQEAHPEDDDDHELHSFTFFQIAHFLHNDAHRALFHRGSLSGAGGGHEDHDSLDQAGDAKDAHDDEHRNYLSRVYLGPPGSGTRQVAEIVFDYFGLDPKTYETHGISNWSDMHSALSSGNVDLAFYLGSPDADVIRRVARSGSCELIGLGDYAPAIQKGHEQLGLASFPEHAYVPHGFSDDEQATLTTRRILVCSSRMSDETAYSIAHISRDALREQVPHLIWDAPGSGASSESTSLSYLLHPGPQMLRNNEVPGWFARWSSVLWPLFLPVLLSFVGIAASRVGSSKQSDKTDGNETTEAAPSQTKSSFELLNGNLEGLLKELEQSPYQVPAGKYRAWEQQLTDVGKKAKEAHTEQQLSDKEFDVLKEGLRKVRTDLEFSHRPKAAPRRKSKAAADSGQ